MYSGKLCTSIINVTWSYQVHNGWVRLKVGVAYISVPKVQFLAFEIARNREGYNVDIS